MAKKRRNEITVGVTVLAVFVLAVYVIIALGDWSNLFTPKKQITFEVPYKVGLKGLMAGSPVLLGGAKIGQVTATGIKPFDADAPPDQIDVYFTIQIPQQYQLKSDCELAPQSNVLGGQAALAVATLGTERGRLLQGDGEPHRLTPQQFKASIAETISSLQNELDPCAPGSALSDLKEAIRQVKAQLTVPPGADPLLTKVHDIIDQVQAELDSGNADAVVARLKAALDHLDASLIQVQQLVQENGPGVGEAVASAQRSLAEVEQLIARVKDPFAQTVESVNQTTAQIRDATPNLLAKIESTLDSIQQAMASAQQALTTANKLLTEARDTFVLARPQIENIIENIDEASVHMKMVMRDIRRKPWRLRKPDEAQVKTQDLIGAAGDYAVGAEKLKVTAETLESLLETSGDLPDRRQRIDEMLTELEDSFQRFQEAEKAFWDKLED